MAYIVRMPKLGLEMETGTVLDWYVDEGSDVEEGDAIAEVESEKSTAEVEARETGVVRRFYVPEGETCEPGDPIGIVAGPDENISALEDTVSGERQGEIATPEPGESERAAEPAQAESAAAAGTEAEAGSGQPVRASPPARKRAEELGIDLATVDGTGPDGAITPDDVEQAAQEDTGAEADETAGGVSPTLREERPLRGTRRSIADRLGESYRNAVHVTELRTVDAGELVAATSAVDESLDADVSVTDVLLLALSETLTEHPGFNAHFEDDAHRLYEEQNVCIAVDTDQGLMAPVLRDVGDKPIEQIATERHELTDLVVEGEHTMDDLSGGTFTVTNLGPFGVEAFNPIINPPQVAILGVNAIARQAVPADDTIEVRQRLPLNLTFDHRVVDGADAARFLRTLAGYLEDPWPLVPDDVQSTREES
jgi:pyruvate/2-oxoglutarate dehydrogenase complex dihydrolipoamide acyltransferase (E2) component